MQAAISAVGVDWIPGPKWIQFAVVAVLSAAIPLLRILSQPDLHDGEPDVDKPAG